MNPVINVTFLKARSHCTIFADCERGLFLFTMGYIGVGDVATVAQCEHFHWILYNIYFDKKNCSRNQKKMHTMNKLLRLCLLWHLLLPPAYVVRREGNSFTLLVCSHPGGVPISHNALQHFPECHGAAGGGGYPARSSRGGGTLPGPAGGVPC